MPSLPQPIIIVGAAPEIVVVAATQPIARAIVEQPDVAVATDGLVSNASQRPDVAERALDDAIRYSRSVADR